MTAYNISVEYKKYFWDFRERFLPFFVVVCNCHYLMYIRFYKRRFLLPQGKFIRIHFGPSGKLAGADIETCTYHFIFNLMSSRNFEMSSIITFSVQTCSRRPVSSPNRPLSVLTTSSTRWWLVPSLDLRVRMITWQRDRAILKHKT